jgi:hypothetical protein
MRRSLPGEDRHFAVGIHAGGMVAGRKRIDAVEVVALYPILQLAGLVAGVCAYFKHGYYDDLYGDGARFGAGCRCQSD